MVIKRSPSPTELLRAFNVLVLPEPVLPEIKIFCFAATADKRNAAIWVDSVPSATIFSSLAAIVTGAAATNYATGATILNGTKTAVSAEVYQGLFATAIIKAINESRDKKKKEILAQQLKGTGEYSVGTAVNDAQDYHFRCSFYHGLVVLTEDSKKRATPSREELLGKIKVLREEITENNQQKKLVGENAIEADDTNKKIQQGINALYDRLNMAD